VIIFVIIIELIVFVIIFINNVFVIIMIVIVTIMRHYHNYYRCKFEARGVEKVTIGINGLW